MTRRASISATLAATVAIAAVAWPLSTGGPAAQEPSPPQQLLLRPGDTVRVEGANLGCQVSERGGRATIECRRVGAARRTYGTFLDEQRAVVARFRSAQTAQTVFSARHGGGWRTCETTARRAPTATAARARGGCR